MSVVISMTNEPHIKRISKYWEERKHLTMKGIYLTAALAGNDSFLIKKTSHKQKKIHDSVKTYNIFIKQKVSGS